MGGKQERSDAERVALSEMGFRIGDKVGNLRTHFNPKTNDVCRGDWGIVADVGTDRATAYVRCHVCKDILLVDL